MVVMIQTFVVYLWGGAQKKRFLMGERARPNARPLGIGLFFPPLPAPQFLALAGVFSPIGVHPRRPTPTPSRPGILEPPSYLGFFLYLFEKTKRKRLVFIGPFIYHLGPFDHALPTLLARSNPRTRPFARPGIGAAAPPFFLCAPVSP